MDSDSDSSENSVGEITIWSKIILDTVEQNKEALREADSSKRKSKFKKYFIENVKVWLLQIQELWENDETKSSIWDTKEKLEGMDDEEAVLTAIDQRKYKLLKHIKWDVIDDMIDEEEDEPLEIDTEDEEEDEPLEIDTEDNEAEQEEMEESGGAEEDE